MVLLLASCICWNFEMFNIALHSPACSLLPSKAPMGLPVFCTAALQKILIPGPVKAVKERTV